MNRILSAFFAILLFTSCNDTELILPTSVGAFGKVLVVTDNSNWQGDIGNEIRQSFGKLQVGLPQPEKTLSVSQISSHGFSSMMKSSRNIFIAEVSEAEGMKVFTNKYASPQTVVYLTAKDKESLLKAVKEKNTEIINVFRSADIKYLQNIFAGKRLDDSKYKTLQN